MSVFTITTNGNLLVSGNNEFGQLGTGNCENVEYPIKIKLGMKISDVSCGASHTIARSIYGYLWVCGSNNLGQLGLGHNEDSYSFVKVSDKQFASVCCYNDYTLAIDKNWVLQECGYNHIANVRTTNFLSKISDRTFSNVCVGSNYIVAIDLLGCLWTCGDNESGQLGFNNLKRRRSLRQVPSPKYVECRSVEIDNNGFLYSVPTRYIEKTVKFKDVGRSATYMMAIDTEGNIWICGEGKLKLRKLGMLVDDDCIEVENIVCGPNVIAAMDIYGRVYKYSFKHVSDISKLENLEKFSRIAGSKFDYFTLVYSTVLCLSRNLMLVYYSEYFASIRIDRSNIFNGYGYMHMLLTNDLTFDIASPKLYVDPGLTVSKFVFGQIRKKGLYTKRAF